MTADVFLTRLLCLDLNIDKLCILNISKKMFYSTKYQANFPISAQKMTDIHNLAHAEVKHTFSK